MKLNLFLLSVLAVIFVVQARPVENTEDTKSKTAAAQRMASALMDGQDEIIAAGGDTMEVAAALARIEAKQKAATEISVLQRTRKQELANPLTNGAVDNAAVDREVNIRRKAAPITRFGDDNDEDTDWDALINPPGDRANNDDENNDEEEANLEEGDTEDDTEWDEEDEEEDED